MATNPPTTASSISPNPYPGMGTILIPGGIVFRVWAPFASAVFAAGTFNQWSETAHPFVREGNGYWSVEVPGAKIGDEYQFVIRYRDQPLLWHNNPYASEVVNSSGNAVIHDPNFDWTGDHFTMPPRNELVIYEMHVGTFNDARGEGHSMKSCRSCPICAIWGSMRSRSCRWPNMRRITRGDTTRHNRFPWNRRWVGHKGSIDS